MNETLGVNAQLVAGSGGVFDITADGELIFSKHKIGRFPDPGEITDILLKKKSGA